MTFESLNLNFISILKIKTMKIIFEKDKIIHFRGILYCFNTIILSL